MSQPEVSLEGAENVANPISSVKRQGTAQGCELAEALLINLLCKECPSLGKTKTIINTVS